MIKLLFFKRIKLNLTDKLFSSEKIKLIKSKYKTRFFTNNLFFLAISEKLTGNCVK